LQVIPTLKNGGVEIEALEIAKAIVEAGGRALIAAKPGSLVEDAIKAGIEIKDLPLDTKNPLQIAKNTRLLNELILKEKVDIVHVRSRAPGWSAYKAARALGIPFVTTYHAAYKSRSVFKMFYNSVMARGDRVIAISQFIQDHLIQKYRKYGWFDPAKIRLIQRGIDLDIFDPSTISKERLDRLRKSWGVSPSMRILLLPGRISRTKGQDLLINALSLMKHTNVMAVCIGSTQGHEAFRDNLLHYTTSLGLADRVKLLPPSPDMPSAYQLADVIVCPSLVPEGFGRVMAEAQAMKKPIVASNHGAAPEVIEDRITGWLFPPGNAQALAQALDKVLDLPQDRLKKLGEKQRTRVKLLFSNESMFAKTIAVYQELLEMKK